MVCLDDSWKWLLVFAAGVLVGWLISKQSTLKETVATAKPYTMLSDFTRDDQGHVISILERYMPAGVPVETVG